MSDGLAAEGELVPLETEKGIIIVLPNFFSGKHDITSTIEIARTFDPLRGLRLDDIASFDL